MANDDYFRGAPKLGGVEVRYIADNTARELGMQAGELDVANGLPEAQFVERTNQSGPSLPMCSALVKPSG